MRIGILTAVVAILSLLGLAAASHSADVAKIGVVDFKKILETSNAGKSAQAEINKHGKKMEEDLKQTLETPLNKHKQDLYLLYIF